MCTLYWVKETLVKGKKILFYTIKNLENIFFIYNLSWTVVCVHDIHFALLSALDKEFAAKAKCYIQIHPIKTKKAKCVTVIYEVKYW